MKLSLKKLLAVLLFATLSVSLVPAAAQIVTEALNTTEALNYETPIFVIPDGFLADLGSNTYR